MIDINMKKLPFVKKPAPTTDEWHFWYAWWPLVTQDKHFVWLERIYRRWIPDASRDEPTGGHWIYSWCRAPFQGQRDR